MSTLTDNSSMTILNNYLLKKVFWLLSMLISKELKESLLLSEPKFSLLLITQTELKKFSVPAIPFNRSWLVKIKSSSSQDANVTKPALSFWEDQVNTFLMKLKDHCMMLSVFWSKLSKTNKLSMVEEMLRCIWPWLAKPWLKPSKENRHLPFKPTPRP